MPGEKNRIAGMQTKCAFTLAEVLIVIGVIGVVAAITNPTLIPLIKDKVDTNRKEVIEDRLIQGLNQLNTLDDGMNASQYSDTEGFVRTLSKHYKMSQICGAENLKDCFPYDKINYTEGDVTKQLDITELKSVEKLGFDTNLYYQPAAFISSQGTPFIISLKKDCLIDSDKAMRDIPQCIIGLYDINGAGIPNKFSVLSDIETSGGDIVSINGGRIGPVAYINGVTLLTRFFKADQATVNCSNEVEKNYGVKKCPPVADKWVDAMSKCHEIGGDLPSIDQSLKIVQGLFYKGDKLNHPDKFKDDGRELILQYYTYNSELAGKIGLPSTSSAGMWTNNDQDDDLYYATERQYRSWITSVNGCNRGNGSLLAVCVVKEN